MRVGGEVLEDRAIGPVVPGAGPDQLAQRGAHRLQVGDLRVDPLQVLLGHRLDLPALAVIVVVEREQHAAVLDPEAQRAGATEELQLVHVALAEAAIAVVRAQRPDEADFLVVADGLGGQAGRFGGVSDVHAGLSCSAGRGIGLAAPVSRRPGMRRRRRAFDSTKTDDNAMAPAASIGDSSIPKAG